MQTWWCAMDTKHTSYAEFKKRGVVAQGWPLIGDLERHFDLMADEDVFKLKIQEIGDDKYRTNSKWRTKDRKLKNAPQVLLHLLQLARHDLVVGIEGTTVCGICEITTSPTKGYQFDAGYEYAHGVGPVEWIDWNQRWLGPPPVAPARSVHGIRHVVSESRRVEDAWALTRRDER